jgi:hypothetical protein
MASYAWRPRRAGIFAITSELWRAGVVFFSTAGAAQPGSPLRSLTPTSPPGPLLDPGRVQGEGLAEPALAPYHLGARVFFYFLAEAACGFVEEAPGPVRAGHHRAHDRVSSFVEVAGRVLADGGIAAADMAACPALPKLHPAGALPETFFAPPRRPWRREIPSGQPFEMFAEFTHGVLLRAALSSVE